MTPASASLHPGVFELVAPYEPAGDQPAAIDALVRGIAEGRASRGLFAHEPSTRSSHTQRRPLARNHSTQTSSGITQL